MSLVTHFFRRSLNIPVYGGPYVNKGWAHQSKGPRDLEEAAAHFKNQLESKVEQPSPFHVVYRYKTKHPTPWTIRVKLRHLGLHGKAIGYPVLVPNTPHFNALLWEIKHLIKLAPVTFPNGLPTEKDIGATRLCPFTGRFEINDKYRVDQSRLYADKPSEFYKGNYLRDYLRKLCGIMSISYA